MCSERPGCQTDGQGVTHLGRVLGGGGSEVAAMLAPAFEDNMILVRVRALALAAAAKTPELARVILFNIAEDQPRAVRARTTTAAGASQR